MWRGPVVQARKNAVNAVKWKIFWLHAKLIALAAVSWKNPDDNPSLANAIYKAKKDWVPANNIEKAIKKWSGEDKDALQIMEILYEWYGPGWVSILVSVLTDNKNRTVASLRHIFSKYGWSMWENGSVSWAFKRKWVLFIDPKKYEPEKIEELVYETSAEDFIMTPEYLKIISAKEDLTEVEKFFEDKNIEIIESKLDFIPDNEVEVTDFEKALKLIKMIEAFHEDEDVNIVATNEIISPQLEWKVHDYIEKHSFKN